MGNESNDFGKGELESIASGKSEKTIDSLSEIESKKDLIVGTGTDEEGTHSKTRSDKSSDSRQSANELTLDISADLTPTGFRLNHPVIYKLVDEKSTLIQAGEKFESSLTAVQAESFETQIEKGELKKFKEVARELRQELKQEHTDEKNLAEGATKNERRELLQSQRGEKRELNKLIEQEKNKIQNGESVDPKMLRMTGDVPSPEK